MDLASAAVTAIPSLLSTTLNYLKAPLRPPSPRPSLLEASPPSPLAPHALTNPIILHRIFTTLGPVQARRISHVSKSFHEAFRAGNTRLTISVVDWLQNETRVVQMECVDASVDSGGRVIYKFAVAGGGKGCEVRSWRLSQSNGYGLDGELVVRIRKINNHPKAKTEGPAAKTGPHTDVVIHPVDFNNRFNVPRHAVAIRKPWPKLPPWQVEQRPEDSTGIHPTLLNRSEILFLLRPIDHSKTLIGHPMHHELSHIPLLYCTSSFLTALTNRSTKVIPIYPPKTITFLERIYRTMETPEKPLTQLLFPIIQLPILLIIPNHPLTLLHHAYKYGDVGPRLEHFLVKVVKFLDETVPQAEEVQRNWSLMDVAAGVDFWGDSVGEEGVRMAKKDIVGRWWKHVDPYVVFGGVRDKLQSGNNSTEFGLTVDVDACQVVDIKHATDEEIDEEWEWLLRLSRVSLHAVGRVRGRIDGRGGLSGERRCPETCSRCWWRGGLFPIGAESFVPFCWDEGCSMCRHADVIDVE